MSAAEDEMPADPLTIAMTVILGGLIGALAGSLIHAISVRLPADLEPIGVPVCVGCAAPLPATAFMPLRPGACPTCVSMTPIHKLATELASGGLTMLALLIHGLTLRGLAVALFSLLLLLILRIDWQHHLIFTVTIVPGIMLALGLAALRSPEALISSVVAAVAAGLVFSLFFALAVLIYRQQALGFGDILLAILLGAMTGISQVFPAIFLGMLLAAAGGLFLVLTGLRTRHDYIPYGAYLCAGTIVVLLIP